MFSRLPRRNPGCGSSVLIAMAFVWFIFNPTVMPFIILMAFLVLFR